MKSPNYLLLLLLTVLLNVPLQAFSPYETYINSKKPKQVGLLARISPGNTLKIQDAIQKVTDGDQDCLLAANGVSNVTAFTRTIGENDWIVVHFVLDGDRDYLSAADLFEKATEATRNLTQLVSPHPRASRFGTRWLQMEWINYIRGRDVDDPATSELMIVTTIIPEKEAEYRSLHQTVWPGVVDQVIRSWSRDLCIFLAEIDGLLVEFLYVEYVGTYREKDDAMSQSDIINHRWWKLTDACQTGLPGVEGNWVEMEQLK